jgi:hypothetical protein
MLEMEDMGVTLRLSVTVYVTAPFTNPVAILELPESGRERRDKLEAAAGEETVGLNFLRSQASRRPPA